MRDHFRVLRKNGHNSYVLSGHSESGYGGHCTPLIRSDDHSPALVPNSTGILQEDTLGPILIVF